MITCSPAIIEMFYGFPAKSGFRARANVGEAGLWPVTVKNDVMPGLGPGLTSTVLNGINHKERHRGWRSAGHDGVNIKHSPTPMGSPSRSKRRK